MKRGLNTKRQREIPAAYTGPSSGRVARGCAAPKQTVVTPRKNKVDAVDDGGRSPPSSVQARTAEIGEILALGYLRLLGRNTRGKASNTRDSWLDISLGQSGHGTPIERGGSRA